MFKTRGCQYTCYRFIQDYKQDVLRLHALKQANKSLKLVVVSEEPLWDSLWSGADFKKRWTKLADSNHIESTINIVQINHFNSDLFSFRYLPYFLTTEYKYLIRYSQLCRKYMSDGHSALRVNYLEQTKDLAGLFERRLGDKYVSKNHPDLCLSDYRSKLAELACFSSRSTSNGISCEFMGKGWSTSNLPRQQLGDWHLDKLIRLKKGFKAILAIENTVSPYYITEKVFDAISSFSRPVHCLDQFNLIAIRDVLNLESVGINLTGTSIEEGLEIIRSELLEPEDCFNKIMFAVHCLSKLCGPLGLEMIQHEAKWRSAKLVGLIKDIL